MKFQTFLNHHVHSPAARLDFDSVCQTLAVLDGQGGKVFELWRHQIADLLWPTFHPGNRLSSHPPVTSHQLGALRRRALWLASASFLIWQKWWYGAGGPILGIRKWPLALTNSQFQLETFRSTTKKNPRIKNDGRRSCRSCCWQWLRYVQGKCWLRNSKRDLF